MFSQTVNSMYNSAGIKTNILGVNISCYNKIVRITGKSSRSPKASINISQNLHLLQLRKRVFKMFYPLLKVVGFRFQ